MVSGVCIFEHSADASLSGYPDKSARVVLTRLRIQCTIMVNGYTSIRADMYTRAERERDREELIILKG